MFRTNKITVTQMVFVLIVCRFYQFLTFTPGQFAQAEGIWALISILCSAVLTFALMTPVFCLNKRYPGLSVIECIGNASGGFARLTALCYGIFAVLVALYTISSFNVFISSTILPQVSMLFLSITMVLAVWYGASRGIEPAARVAFVILILFFLSLIWIAGGIIPYLDVHTMTGSQNGNTFWTFLKSVFSRTVRDMEAMLFVLMIPTVKGDKRKGFAWYLGIYAILSILCTLLMWFSLGKLAQYQRFPFYALASMAKAPLLDRMDSIHIALWTFFAYLRAGIYLYFAGVCFSHFKVRDTTKRVLSVLGIAGLIFLVTMVSKHSVLLHGLRVFLSSGICTLLLIIVFPVVIILIRRKQDERN